MTQELIYTSAPRGLRPGSSGFCTVAATQGMPASLIERLERISGYRPLFGPLDGRVDLNPVAVSYQRLVQGGKTVAVLSRIAPAGLDYSQRGNLLAHHVVLEPSEWLPAGPASLAQQPGFFKTEWNGFVGPLPPGRRPLESDDPSGPCRAWESAVGDAGWAGSLVETWERDSERPLYLVFQPGQPVLTLLAEALALLGPEKRWNVTFSTYFTGGQPGVSCGWRCVPAGSPEALEAEGAGHWILDLTRDLGRAPGSPWVDRARAGRVAHRNETGTARPVSVPGGEALKTASAWEDSSALLPDWSELTASEGGIAAAAAQTQAPPVPTRKLAGAALPVGAPLLPHLPDRASERRRTPWPLVAVGVVMLAVGIGLGLGLARLNLNERPIDDARPEPVANPSTEKPFAKDGPEKKDANKAVPPVRPPEKERQPEPRPPDKPAAQPRKPGELKDEIKAPSPAPVKQLDLLAYKELETLDGWKDLLKDLHEAKPGQEAAALQKSLPRLNAAVGALNKARSRHEEWKKGLGAALDARPFTPLREMLEKDQDVESGMISRAFKDGLDTMKRDWYQAEAQKDRRALAAERLDRLTALIDKFKKEKAKPSKPDTEFNQQLIRLGAILALLADFEDKGYLKGIAPLNDADPTKIRDSVYGKDGILKNLNSEFFPDEFPKDGPRKEARPDPSR